MIYTVTTFQKIAKYETDSLGTRYELPYPSFGERECWGYYPSLDDALKCVKKYGKAMHQGQFSYCIIEGYNSGFMPKGNDRYLFRWYKGKYLPVSEPAIMDSVMNFALS